ncbi:MAG: hypothetical protein HYT87_05410 [Nitrospirae bacterium]|nr:hypothetical protein [Nitrospirota bacterium]
MVGQLKGMRIRALCRVARCTLLLMVCPAAMSGASNGTEIPLETIPGPDVQEIEVVLIEGKKPSVTFRFALTVSVEPRIEVLSGPAVDLLPRLGDPVAQNGCESDVVRSAKSYRLTPKGNAHAGCRWLIPFGGKDDLLDVLSFGSLALKVSGIAAFTFSLADRIGPSIGAGTEVAKSNGKLDLTLPLASIAPSVDLRRLAGFVVTLGKGGKSVTIDKARLAAISSDSSLPLRTGLWLWEYKDALQDPRRTIETCLSLQCTRLSIQIPDLAEGEEVWKAYGELLSAAQKQGIESLALDGYPEAVLNPDPLVGRVEKALSLPGNAAAGIQLDIEPYLLPQFAADPEIGDRKYVELISRLAALVGERSSLSVVMPFWFNQRRVEGRPVGFSVMNIVDDVAVMSYRTDRGELFDISGDWIRYSRLTGVPVWLAIETRPLALEEHIVLVREADPLLAQARVEAQTSRLIFAPPAADGIPSFRIRERYLVRPERLSFAGRSKKRVSEFISEIGSSPAASGLSGVMIHDWTGYRVLPE